MKDRIGIFFVFLVGVILISTSQYLSWTPLKAGTIEGLQGRYFIPISPLFVLLFYPGSILQNKVLSRYGFPVKIVFYGSISVSLFCTIAVLIKRYYWPG
jgi:uncharacterized membrane protein